MIIRLLFLAVFIVGCQIPTPKPKAQLALEYPNPQYNTFESQCPFKFEYNNMATPKSLSACGLTLDYAPLNASLYITYFDLSIASLDTLFMDFEKRLNMFGKQSTQLNESAFENKETNVLGACVMLAGDSPSNLHFFGTDSKKHYLTGSLLFNTVPNYDSLVPALSYIKTDVQKLLESLHWD